MMAKRQKISGGALNMAGGVAQHSGAQGAGLEPLGVVPLEGDPFPLVEFEDPAGNVVEEVARRKKVRFFCTE